MRLRARQKIVFFYITFLAVSLFKKKYTVEMRVCSFAIVSAITSVRECRQSVHLALGALPGNPDKGQS